MANVGWGDGVFAGETIDERIKSWGGGRRWAVGARGSRADGYGGNGLMSACVRRRGDATGGVGPAARGSKCAKNLGVLELTWKADVCFPSYIVANLLVWNLPGRSMLSFL